MQNVKMDLEDQKSEVSAKGEIPAFFGEVKDSVETSSLEKSEEENLEKDPRSDLQVELPSELSPLNEAVIEVQPCLEQVKEAVETVNREQSEDENLEKEPRFELQTEPGNGIQLGDISNLEKEPRFQQESELGNELQLPNEVVNGDGRTSRSSDQEKQDIPEKAQEGDMTDTVPDQLKPLSEKQPESVVQQLDIEESATADTLDDGAVVQSSSKILVADVTTEDETQLADIHERMLEQDTDDQLIPLAVLVLEGSEEESENKIQSGKTDKASLQEAEMDDDVQVGEEKGHPIDLDVADEGFGDVVTDTRSAVLKQVEDDDTAVVSDMSDDGRKTENDEEESEDVQVEDIPDSISIVDMESSPQQDQVSRNVAENIFKPEYETVEPGDVDLLLWDSSLQTEDNEQKDILVSLTETVDQAPTLETNTTPIVNQHKLSDDLLQLVEPLPQTDSKPKLLNIPFENESSHLNELVSLTTVYILKGILSSVYSFNITF